MSTHDTSEAGHGNSPAAWAAVIIMLVAFTIGTFAFWFDIAWLVWASAGLVVVGAIVGQVLKRAGYGVDGSKIQPRPQSAAGAAIQDTKVQS